MAWITPTRGEIYYADLDPGVGSRQDGKRPVLIIQNNVGNRFSPTVIVAAITGNRSKQSIPTHVTLGRTCGLKYESVALFEQIFTLDKQVLHGPVGKADASAIPKINRAIQCSLGPLKAE